MKAVIQRVSHAKVEVDNRDVGQIGRGMVILLGVSQQDTKDDADYLVKKIINLRIFEDDDRKMNLSLLEVGGEILAISQFTLYANTRKGRRPSFIEAALPEEANRLYQYFIQRVEGEGVRIDQGVFGAMMLVHIHNDGPVTIILDSAERHKHRE